MQPYLNPTNEIWKTIWLQNEDDLKNLVNGRQPPKIPSQQIKLKPWLWHCSG
jgi:hypothetical protein